MVWLVEPVPLNVEGPAIEVYSVSRERQTSEADCEVGSEIFGADFSQGQVTEVDYSGWVLVMIPD